MMANQKEKHCIFVTSPLITKIQHQINSVVCKDVFENAQQTLGHSLPQGMGTEL